VKQAVAAPEPILPHDDWRSLLYQRLRGRAYPLLEFDAGILPAAALWAGARRWIAGFRSAGLTAGDRVALALPASPAFVQILIAGIWEGLTLVPLAPPATLDTLEKTVVEIDARCAIATAQYAPSWACTAHFCAGPEPEDPPLPLRTVRLAPTPDVRFLLQTSGTSGAGRFIALSDRNVLSVLESHLPALGLAKEESRVLSVLPWHHAFGLVLDLMTSLLAGVELRRVTATGEREVAALCCAGEEMAATHLNAVPLTIRRLAATERGRQFLRSLKGGIVGGAPVDAELAAFLTTTQLRAGYGQTEAAPGIALGNPGQWPGHGFLGRPLGCRIRVEENGVLSFHGENTCIGEWKQEQGLCRLDPDRWRSTGDYVAQTQEGDLFFRGRDDDRFKLSNGRPVQAALWEAKLLSCCPSVTEALLYTPDGESVVIALSLSHSTESVPEDLISCLGGLAPRLKEVQIVGDSFWVRTPKGSRIRQACIEKLIGRSRPACL